MVLHHTRTKTVRLLVNTYSSSKGLDRDAESDDDVNDDDDDDDGGTQRCCCFCEKKRRR